MRHVICQIILWFYIYKKLKWLRFAIIEHPNMNPSKVVIVNRLVICCMHFFNNLMRKCYEKHSQRKYVKGLLSKGENLKKMHRFGCIGSISLYRRSRIRTIFNIYIEKWNIGSETYGSLFTRTTISGMAIFFIDKKKR